MPPLVAFLIVGALLFAIGLVGLLLKRNSAISLLMSIELMLLAVNTNFIAFSYFVENLAGQIFVLFVLTVAAAEAAIGLAVIVLLFRNYGTVSLDELNILKG